MGLVEYSDSESDSESIQQPPRKPTPAAAASAPSSNTNKKPFQRIVDRSKPGKIVVSLPGAASTGQASTNLDEPPAKRARTGGGGGGGAFSGFNALLPPPKNAGKPTVSSSSGKAAPRPGVNLKTGATPGFSRNPNPDGGVDDFGGDEDGGRATAEPSIPAGQKPADEVKLVGKPMMFKPLSVSRKPTKTRAAAASKPTVAAKATASATAPTETANQAPAHESSVAQTTDEPPTMKKKKQKMSLFSITQEDNNDTGATSNGSGVYEPVFSEDTGMSTQEAFAQYDAQYANPASASGAPVDDYSSNYQQQQQQPSTQTGHSLDSIASDLNLSAAARRELFGRTGVPGAAQSASRVINFNTDREYAANEELRASGEAQPAHNPVRAIAPGKHSLRQLVNQVQNQRDALEESFAKGHRNRTEASAKYGWR